MRLLRTISLVVVLMTISYAPAGAQEHDPELSLSMRRDFGYRAGDRIQGKFTLEAFGPTDLISVEFLLDGEPIGEVGERPFRFSFSTSQFSLGRHTLMARGTTSAGRALHSPERSFEFVSAEESYKSAAGLAIPLIIVVAILTILGTVVPGLLSGRRGAFRVGVYGASGGAICPRCELPYSRHFFAPNFFGRKLERCPHCGKWAWVSRATTDHLRAAEARMLESDTDAFANEEGESQRLRRMIDDSKFLD